jgi:mannose-6-phosphate isomerase
MTNAYPLQLQPELKDKVWGGQSLEAMLGLERSGRKVGEAWLVYEDLRVANGAWAGRTLAGLTKDFPDLMLGAQHAASIINGVPRFPLLAKFLDPSEWLSVQVHPDDAYAREKEHMPYGKCEAWYVVRSEAGARIIHGLSQPISRERLIDAAKSGEIKGLMDYVELHLGEAVINMPGIIHALGPGLVIYEIQQSSDITYRLYDWDRPASAGRELHLEQSGDVSDYAPIDQHRIRPLTLQGNGATRTLFAACRYFAAEKVDVRSRYSSDTLGTSPHLLTALHGAGVVVANGTAAELGVGQSVVIPAQADAYHIEPAGELSLICSFVPDLLRDVIAPLQRAGYGNRDIAQLGGHLRRSDLNAMLFRQD